MFPQNSRKKNLVTKITWREVAFESKSLLSDETFQVRFGISIKQRQSR